MLTIATYGGQRIHMYCCCILHAMVYIAHLHVLSLDSLKEGESTCHTTAQHQLLLVHNAHDAATCLK